MPKGGSRYHTSRPCKANRYYSGEISKSDSSNSTSSELNPLESPESFSITRYCGGCEEEFKMSLPEHNELNSNCGNLYIKNRAKSSLCPKCYKSYIRRQNSLAKKGLLTDIEIEAIAKKRTVHPYRYDYQLGYINGMIEMRDGKENIIKTH